MGLGEEDNRGNMPFHHVVSMMCSQHDLPTDVELALAEAVLAGFPHHPVISRLPPHAVSL